MKRMQLIWDTIRDVPKGSVASYGQIAEIAGIKRGARQVGYALRHLPANQKVPWHRIITASGKIAFAVGSDKFDEQAGRLIKEGVVILNGKVDMRVYRWQPNLDEFLWKPSDAWDGDDGDGIGGGA